MGENFRFGHRAKGDVGAPAGPGRLHHPGGRAGRGRRRGGVLQPHPPPRRGGRRRRAPTGCWARRSSCAGRSRTATSAGARWATRPPTSCPTRRSSAPPTASTRAGRRSRSTARGSGGRRPRASACARPSSPGLGLLAEAFLLGFDGDLYGRELRLSFLARLRGEERFASVEALVDQMARDVEDTRRARAPDPAVSVLAEVGSRVWLPSRVVNVLLAHGSAAARRRMARTLRRAGHRVLEAGGAGQAVESCRAARTRRARRGPRPVRARRPRRGGRRQGGSRRLRHRGDPRRAAGARRRRRRRGAAPRHPRRARGAGPRRRAARPRRGRRTDEDPPGGAGGPDAPARAPPVRGRADAALQPPLHPRPSSRRR